MNEKTWGRKLSTSFVKEGSRRLIEIRDNKNVVSWVFIAVSKEGVVSVFENYNEKWEKMKSDPFAKRKGQTK